MAGADGYTGKDGKVKVYRGFYEAVVRFDFRIDKETDDILPFDELKENVEGGGLTRDLTTLLLDNVGALAKVSVTQTGAELMNIPERRTKHVQ